MRAKFIVWTGKLTEKGILFPSQSISSGHTVEEVAAMGRSWQELVHRGYPGRKAGACVITTYGAQKIVGSVPELLATGKE